MICVEEIMEEGIPHPWVLVDRICKFTRVGSVTNT